MKKIAPWSVATMLIALLITGCKKDDVYDPGSYWLSQERGYVVYSGSY